LNPDRLAGDRGDERVCRGAEAHREFEEAEAEILRPDDRHSIDAFDHDRPPPGAVLPPVRENRRARPRPRLRGHCLAGVNLFLERVTLQGHLVGLGLELMNLGFESVELEPDQRLAAPPAFRLEECRLSRGFQLRRFAVSLRRLEELVGLGRHQFRDCLRRRVFGRRWRRRLGLLGLRFGWRWRRPGDRLWPGRRERWWGNHGDLRPFGARPGHEPAMDRDHQRQRPRQASQDQDQRDQLGPDPRSSAPHGKGLHCPVVRIRQPFMGIPATVSSPRSSNLRIGRQSADT
jgi:hypothetical protein